MEYDREGVKNKRFLLVGKTGSGKSTVANVLHGSAWETLDSPFEVGDNASGVTTLYKIEAQDDRTIIDTVGFGDPQFTEKEIVRRLKEAVDELSKGLDVIIYVFKKDRLTAEVFHIFQYVVDHVFQGKCYSNTALFITNCENVNDWVAANRGKNQYLQEMLEKCHLGFFGHNFPEKSEDTELEGLLRERRRNRAEETSAKLLTLEVTRFVPGDRGILKEDLWENIKNTKGFFVKLGYKLDKGLGGVSDWLGEQCKMQ